jgi:hypothetical protein
VRRESAIRTLLSAWKAARAGSRHRGRVEGATLSCPGEIVHGILDELEIPWSVAIYQKQRSEAFVREL